MLSQVSESLRDEADAEQRDQYDDVEGYPSHAGPLTDVEGLPEELPEGGEDLEEKNEKG